MMVEVVVAPGSDTEASVRPRGGEDSQWQMVYSQSLCTVQCTQCSLSLSLTTLVSLQWENLSYQDTPTDSPQLDCNKDNIPVLAAERDRQGCCICQTIIISGATITEILR